VGTNGPLHAACRRFPPRHAVTVALRPIAVQIAFFVRPPMFVRRAKCSLLKERFAVRRPLLERVSDARRRSDALFEIVRADRFTNGPYQSATASFSMSDI
jgi:hypothetical protein